MQQAAPYDQSGAWPDRPNAAAPPASGPLTTRHPIGADRATGSPAGNDRPDLYTATVTMNTPSCQLWPECLKRALRAAPFMAALSGLWLSTQHAERMLFEWLFPALEVPPPTEQIGSCLKAL